MAKAKLKKHRALLYAAAAVIAAAVLRQIGFRVEDPLDWLCPFCRSAIYIVLFAAWGISVRRRIIHPQVRRYLTAVSVLVVFWVTVRTIRYLFAETPWVLRHLWYLYYLPMLFIPLLAVFVALSLGKPENYRLPKWTKPLYIPTAALLLLVLTNDLHQLVFTFPADAVVWANDYRHSIGYFLAVGWMILCTVTALVTMLVKCRIPHSRKVLFLPFAPAVLAVVYGALYILRLPWLRVIAGDVTVVFCLLFTATLESCIQCGLIQSNTHYRELFDASTVGAQITDEDYRTYLSSQNARSVSEAVLRQTEGGPVLLPGGIRLCAAGIRGGHIFWQENVAELLRILKELNDTRDELSEYSTLLEEENKQKQERCELEEQERLYDAMRQTVSPAMERLAALIDRLNRAGDRESARALHSRIAVLGAYIKRRSNLVFLSDETGAVSSRELLLCLNESMSNLHLAGMECAVSLDGEESMGGETAGQLYDFFEETVEAVWESLPAVNVVVDRRSVGWRMTLMLECETELQTIRRRFPEVEVEQDEEMCYCRLTVTEGGARA
ncbi:MAG: histidine kinase N-terminal 7TM domain-containing protein [Oscillospiraceae bacterium]